MPNLLDQPQQIQEIRNILQFYYLVSTSLIFLTVIPMTSVSLTPLLSITSSSNENVVVSFSSIGATTSCEIFAI